MGDNFALRLTTGVVAAAYLAVALVFRGWLYYSSVVAISLMALWEANHAINESGKKTSVWAAFVYAGAMVPVYLVSGTMGVFALYVACLLATLFTLVMRGNDDWSVTSVLVYPLLPLTCLLLLRDAVDDPGLYSLALWLAFGVAFGTDTFAYLFGRLFGRRRIPALVRFSPHKTLEGFIGGIAGGILISWAIVWWWGAQGIMTMWWEWLVIGFAGAVFSEMGDLTASAIKRSCGIKDFGRFFPGHGGVLDRLDGVLFNAVWVLVYFGIRGIVT